MASSDNQVITLTPKKVAMAIEALWATKVAMFLWGPPGTAKSQIAQTVATARGVAFIDLRLSQMDPCDLRGIPYPTVIGGVQGVRWSTPYIMPKDLDVNVIVPARGREIVHFGNPIGSNGIHYCTKPEIKLVPLEAGQEVRNVVAGLDRVEFELVDANGELTSGDVRVLVTGKTEALLALEEFNSAPQTVVAASYQLILDLRLGEYIVPEGVYLMGMGNRDTDKGITFKMATPVANRYCHVEMAAGSAAFDDWQEWAVLSSVHPEVVGYLSTFKNHLFNFEPGSASRGFTTPRSWEFVSKILIANPTAPDEIINALICGAIGHGVGVQFDAFRKVAKDLPKADEILSGKLLKMPSSSSTTEEGKVETSLSFAMTTTLCYELRDRLNALKNEAGINGVEYKETDEFAKWCDAAGHFLTFMMNNFQHEIIVMGARTAIKIHNLPFNGKNVPVFKDFSRQYGKLILSN
jgi:hypothetical protein